MALEQPPGVLNVESIDSSVQRHTTAALAGNRQGVCGATDFAVAQSSTPGMSVSVAAGYALVKGSTTIYQGVYSAHNDASIDDVAISPGDSSNPRYDIVGLLIEDADFSGADRQVSVHVVEGTPAGSPSDPSLPDSFLPLARVQVDANESTSILNADITDLRVHANRGIATTISGALSSPLSGEMWWDAASGRLMRRVTHGGSEYNQIVAGAMPAVNCTRSGGGTITSGSYQNLNLNFEVSDTDEFHSSTSPTFTVPAGMGGDYILELGADFAANSTGVRGVRASIASNTLATNEVATVGDSRPAQATGTNELTASKHIRLEAGATVTLQGYQNSGGPLTVATAFMTLTMVRHLPWLS